MKMQSYSPEDIFEKQLLMLIPFYIFSHEDSFADYNGSSHRLTELQNEYKKILDRLNNLEEQGIIGAFDKRTIIELSSDVIKEITQKYENVQKGVGGIMGGALIETEARVILNQGISQGKILGIDEAKKKTAVRMLKKGKLSVEEVAEYSELAISEVQQLAKDL